MGYLTSINHQLTHGSLNQTINPLFLLPHSPVPRPRRPEALTGSSAGFVKGPSDRGAPLSWCGVVMRLGLKSCVFIGKPWVNQWFYRQLIMGKPWDF